MAFYWQIQSWACARGMSVAFVASKKSIKTHHEYYARPLINIVCIGISTPLPQKHRTFFFGKPPLQSANCPSPPPPLGNSPYILDFRDPSFLKIGYFSEPA